MPELTFILLSITLLSEFPSSSSSRHFILLFSLLIELVCLSNFLVIDLLLEIDCINVTDYQAPLYP